jgi:outer membrane protein TolC
MKVKATLIFFVLFAEAWSSASAQSPTMIAGQSNPLLSGIPSGGASTGMLSLTLKDAVDRGLRYNLGIALGQQNTRAAQSARLRALSGLLPRLSAETSESVRQVNLASVGFSGLPGVPPIVGPFSVFDTRVIFSQSLSIGKVSELRAGEENLKAAQYANRSIRDLVAFTCLQLYMQALTSGSRVEANQAQLKTARTLLDLAISRREAGLIPGIEVLRAQVQMQAQQQRLIVADNELAKGKLALAQAIGLPLGQEFELADKISFVPLTAVSADEIIAEACRSRQDLLSLQAQVNAAEEMRKSAERFRWPSFDLNAAYGVNGNRPFSAHGNFAMEMSLRIPIFQGKEAESRVLAADAQLEKQRAELESMRARISYEVRTVLLDVKSSEEKVKVARSNLTLAGEQVTQSQDRFAAGVVSNIEVVQAQDAYAVAMEDYISSLYAHTVAKVTLAESMGMAESGYEQMLRGK